MIFINIDNGVIIGSRDTKKWYKDIKEELNLVSDVHEVVIDNEDT